MSDLIERSITEKLWGIRGEILRITQELDIETQEISYEETAQIRSKLMIKFTGSDNWNFPWAHLTHPNIATYSGFQCYEVRFDRF
jgi:hypothetical protein